MDRFISLTYHNNRPTTNHQPSDYPKRSRGTTGAPEAATFSKTTVLINFSSDHLETKPPIDSYALFLSGAALQPAYACMWCTEYFN